MNTFRWTCATSPHHTTPLTHSHHLNKCEIGEICEKKSIKWNNMTKKWILRETYIKNIAFFVILFHFIDFFSHISPISPIVKVVWMSEGCGVVWWGGPCSSKSICKLTTTQLLVSYIISKVCIFSLFMHYAFYFTVHIIVFISIINR